MNDKWFSSPVYGEVFIKTAWFLPLFMLIAVSCISCSSSAPVPEHLRELPSNRTVIMISMSERHGVTLRREEVIPLLLSHNLEIAEAKERVHEHRALYRAAWQHLVPILQPGWSSVHVEGGVSSTHGPVLTEESYAWAGSLLSWVINPGQAVYDLLLAHQSLRTSQDQERLITEDVIHQTLQDYNALMLSRHAMLLAQARLRQAEALTQLEEQRWNQGTGLEIDRLRARAQESKAKMDLLDAGIQFYKHSSDLVVRLHLEPDLLVVPPENDLQIQKSVQIPVHVEQASALAIMNRPDLAIIRDRIQSSQLRRQQLMAALLSPQVQGGAMLAPAPPTGSTASTLIRESRQSWNVRWLITPEWEAQFAVAISRHRVVSLDMAHRLDDVRARLNLDGSRASALMEQITLSRQLEHDADKAVQLAQVQNQTGTMLEVDVLMAQSKAAEAHYKTAALITQMNDCQDDLLEDMGLLNPENN